jgi:outer membrane immunogenic protein
MMQKTWAGAAALAITLAAGLAGAADFPAGRPYTAVAPASGYSWTGPYLGGNLGYQWGSTSGTAGNPSGIAGGVHGGYNWQTGQFVFGGEADISASAASDTFAAWKFSNRWFGTVWPSATGACSSAAYRKARRISGGPLGSGWKSA